MIGPGRRLVAAHGKEVLPTMAKVRFQTAGQVLEGNLSVVITRLYVNNFRCLVAFESRFESFGLLCGPNGSGKSTVFDSLRVLRDMASGDVMLDRAVGQHDLTSWLSSEVIEFELELTSEGHTFLYRLHVEQRREDFKARIIHEEASCDRRSLFERDLKGVRFLKESGAQTGFPLDWRQAALGSIQPAGDRQEIEILQKAVNGLLILRPSPRGMEFESRGESARPDLHLANLTSWYRSLSQEQEWTDCLRDSLQSVWPDFKSFRLVNVGLQSKALQLRFESSGDADTGSLYFDQLSDGEKMLVGLYMVQSALATGVAHTVLIDEPDNFVGLQELQPWVINLMGLLDEQTQAVLISHHPEILDTAGEQFGRYLWRESHTSPTRIGPLQKVEGLTIGETMARGWLGG